ncbi:Chaotic nuclear migration protein [Actinidia chinensis var. chinensis]|uniref:Chaotic nuclear migration protein n=1 Tax=Actinidia chinensis var. chinensis TaxID=1590841 RepID=A0A2R6PSP1_ACTCC|nr:Chaotic nuclear migration protein [Actinidia chinensis var. chinensis]
MRCSQFLTQKRNPMPSPGFSSAFYGSNSTTSGGGLTVPSNLRILLGQVCKKKHNKLEFQIPWWDLQLGISINQFLSIFASSNSDFRHRAFSLLFSKGKSEVINTSDSELACFPPTLYRIKGKGRACSGCVVSFEISRHQPKTELGKKLKTSVSKENEDMVTNSYQAIVTGRDSLRQREETAKVQGEIQKLDDEVDELKQKTEDERVSIQELALVLIKRRRRAEKCCRLAKAQSSYRVMLEKMI